MSAREIVKILKSGGIGILPTDTIYGLVGRADSPSAIARIQKLKKRQKGKPFIILISSIKDLDKFHLKIDKGIVDFLKTVWPGPVSVAFNSKQSFRLPQNKLLANIIRETGPLVAPSANPAELPPAETITKAKEYFADKVDFYYSANKRLAGQPSTLIGIKKKKIVVLRQGRKKIKNQNNNGRIN